MRTTYAILVLALPVLIGALPVIAADGDKPAVAPGMAAPDNACLQNNRLWSWQVVNSRTIAITDRTAKKFTIKLAGGCYGLTNLVADIEIRGVASLSCVRRGDFVRFREPTLGPMSCAITEVDVVPAKPQVVKNQVN